MSFLKEWSDGQKYPILQSPRKFRSREWPHHEPNNSYLVVPLCRGGESVMGAG